MTDLTPTREDKFSFGLSTVGWQGVDGLARRSVGMEVLDQPPSST